MNDTSEWSFSLWDESHEFDELYDSETETSSIDKDEEVCEPVNHYNPFILCKMNSFKRKQVKLKSKVFTKYMKISCCSIMPNISKSNSSSLNWNFDHKWIQRRGFPSEILIEGFCEKLGCASYQLNDSISKDWYIIGTTCNNS